MREERQSQRVEHRLGVEIEIEGARHAAASRNVSTGGMFLETDADIPTGALMTLDFSVPGAGTTSLNGAVAWRRSIEEARHRREFPASESQQKAA